MSVVPTLGGDVLLVQLAHQFSGGVGHRDVQLLSKNSDVQPQKPLLHRQLFARFHRVVNQVAQQHAQVNIADRELGRHRCV